jgi:hypothetical protein
MRQISHKPLLSLDFVGDLTIVSGANRRIPEAFGKKRRPGLEITENAYENARRERPGGRFRSAEKALA